MNRSTADGGPRRYQPGDTLLAGAVLGVLGASVLEVYLLRRRRGCSPGSG
jgi:hypothetical protein